MRPQVGRRRLAPRVWLQREALNVGLPTDGEARAVRAGQRHRPVGHDVRHPPERPRPRVAQVPREHVQARLVRDARLGRRPPRPRLVLVLERVGGEDAIDLHAVADPGALQAVGPHAPQAVGAHAVSDLERILLAREAPDQAPRPIEDVERHRSALFLQPVVDHRAVGRVLAHRMRIGAAAEEAAAPVHPVGLARLEQVRGFTRHGPRQLPQGRDVVQDPERAAVRRRDQVALLERQIVHRHDGEIETQRLPARAVVERYPDAPFRSDEQQTGSHRVLTDGAHELGRGDAVDDLPPGAPVVGRLVDVGRHVFELVAVRRNVRRAGGVVRRLDDGDARERRDRRRRHILPGLAGIARDVDQSVVRARPDQPFHARRLGEGEDRAVVLGRGLIERDRPA